MDYDPKAGQLGADNLYAGYSWGRTTVGVGHSMLNAVDENGSAATTIKSQQVRPFLSVGKPSGKGLNLAANGGYDFAHGILQYAGAQAVYNWNCCGLTFGYRRFDLGTVRARRRSIFIALRWRISDRWAIFGARIRRSAIRACRRLTRGWALPRRAGGVAFAAAKASNRLSRRATPGRLSVSQLGWSMLFEEDLILSRIQIFAGLLAVGLAVGCKAQPAPQAAPDARLNRRIEVMVRTQFNVSARH